MAKLIGVIFLIWIIGSILASNGAFDKNSNAVSVEQYEKDKVCSLIRQADLIYNFNYYDTMQVANIYDQEPEVKNIDIKLINKNLYAYLSEIKNTNQDIFYVVKQNYLVEFNKIKPTVANYDCEQKQ